MIRYDGFPQSVSTAAMTNAASAATTVFVLFILNSFCTYCPPTILYLHTRQHPVDVPYSHFCLLNSPSVQWMANVPASNFSIALHCAFMSSNWAVRLSQFPNVPVMMLVTFLGTETLLSDVQFKNAILQIVVTPLGIVTLSSNLQSLNIPSLIAFTSSGIAMLSSDVQPANAYSRFA